MTASTPPTGAQTTPDEPIYRGIVRLGWPVFISQLAIMANGLIDTVMAGRLSVQDLAAVGLGAAIYISVYISIMGVLVALGPIAAHHFGAGKFHEIGEDVRQCLWLGMLLAGILITLLVFPAPFIALAQPSAATEEKLRLYLLALACSAPAALSFRAFTTFSTSVSLPRMVMVLNLIGLALKVPLNLVFMHGYFGAPALGGAGCAVATAVISWACAAIAWWLVAKRPEYQRFCVFERWSWPDWHAIRQIAKLGVPMGISFAVDVTAFTFMSLFIARLGDHASGAHQIAANLAAMVFMLPLGISQATMVLTGQALGAGDHRRAQATGWAGLQFGMGCALLVSLLLFLGHDWIARFYSRDASVVALASVLVWFVAAYHPVDAAQSIAAHILRAYKITVVPMLVYVIALWGFGLGGGYVLGLKFGMGTHGFWAAAIVSAAIAAVALIWYFAWVAQRVADPPAGQPAAP